MLVIKLSYEGDEESWLCPNASPIRTPISGQQHEDRKALEPYRHFINNCPGTDFTMGALTLVITSDIWVLEPFYFVNLGENAYEAKPLILS